MGRFLILSCKLLQKPVPLPRLTFQPILAIIANNSSNFVPNCLYKLNWSDQNTAELKVSNSFSQLVMIFLLYQEFSSNSCNNFAIRPVVCQFWSQGGVTGKTLIFTISRQKLRKFSDSSRSVGLLSCHFQNRFEIFSFKVCLSGGIFFSGLRRLQPAQPSPAMHNSSEWKATVLIHSDCGSPPSEMLILLFV